MVLAQDTGVAGVGILDQFFDDDRTRRIDALQVMEHQAQQLQLAEMLVGETARVAQGKSGEQGPGRFDLLADASGEGDREGGQAG